MRHNDDRSGTRTFDMKPLPRTQHALLVRTDFSNPQAWDDLRRAIHDPTGLFVTSLTFVDDPAYTGLTRADLLSLDENDRPTFVFIADTESMRHPDHPVLVLDIFDASGPVFRAIPSQIPSIETNLSLGNMDAEDFAGSAGPDGIFRGF